MCTVSFPGELKLPGALKYPCVVLFPGRLTLPTFGTDMLSSAKLSVKSWGLFETTLLVLFYCMQAFTIQQLPIMVTLSPSISWRFYINSVVQKST